ncbi:phage virion morphogenesis protein [Spongiimicrobium salis]|uniref:phage virion morphogenesis protein n=1 Tax=Spongiimicrobium salis TaxID=1667022 RepID=UPI00374D7977
MADNNAQELDELRRKFLKLKRTLPRKAGIKAVNFFKRNFRRGGFVDRPFRRWKESGDKRKGGKTLVRSGRLRRNIKILRINGTKITIGVPKNIKYARIHNEGGKIKITPKMRRKFWAMYIETGNDMYKGMALTKKTHIEIPQRQYIGNSKALEVSIKRLLVKELKTLE